LANAPNTFANRANLPARAQVMGQPLTLAKPTGESASDNPAGRIER
jgi:hypothetical protein